LTTDGRLEMTLDPLSRGCFLYTGRFDRTLPGFVPSGRRIQTARKALPCVLGFCWLLWRYSLLYDPGMKADVVVDLFGVVEGVFYEFGDFFLR